MLRGRIFKVRRKYQIVKLKEIRVRNLKKRRVSVKINGAKAKTNGRIEKENVI